MVDYFLLSARSLKCVHAIHVHDHHPDWLDHSHLSVTFGVCSPLPDHTMDETPPNTLIDLQTTLEDASVPVDCLLAEILWSQVVASPDSLADLYGSAYLPVQPHPISVWVEAAKLHHEAATSVVWQTDSKQNLSAYPPSQKTHCHALLAGICLAISCAPGLSPLTLYLPSKSLIHDICFFVPEKVTHGVTCPDYNLLSILVSVMKNCICPVEFRMPSSKSGKDSQAALVTWLAKSVALEHSATHGIFLGEVDCVPLPISSDHCQVLIATRLIAAKVFTDILSPQHGGEQQHSPP